MRYSVMSKTLSIQEVQNKCILAGASNIKVKPIVKQIFCDLSSEALKKLTAEHGIKISPMHKIRPATLVVAPTSPAATTGGLNLHTIYSELRQLYLPPLIGSGLTVAMLDSGIRETHEALEGKVVYARNYSNSTGLRDIFGHGTSVAYVVAGQYGDKSGVAPGAKLMNIKVLDDNGTGTDENLVDGIEAVCQLVQDAINNGLHMTDEMYPNTISLSIGAEDDGDPDNPIRVACQVAVADYGIQIIAAVGNGGPDLSTILVPAVDLSVIAVGGLKTWEFIIWEESSRGPTLEGYVKPDLVCWAENIEVADAKADDGYKVVTGTSFSTPMLAGVDGLLWDLTRRIYGRDVRITYYDWLPYASAYTIKPENVPLAKDNTYGYGIPAVGSMVNQLMRPVSPVSSMMEAMIPMMMLSVMMPMMAV